MAGSCYRYCGVWLMLRDLVLISPFGFNAVKRKFEASLKTRKNGRGELLAGWPSDFKGLKGPLCTMAIYIAILCLSEVLRHIVVWCHCGEFWNKISLVSHWWYKTFLKYFVLILLGLFGSKCILIEFIKLVQNEPFQLTIWGIWAYLMYYTALQKL